MNWLFWALLAMVFWGLSPIFAKLGLVKSDPFTALLIRTIGVFAALLLWGLATARLGSLKEVEPRTWALLLGEGLAASVVGHFAYFRALQAGKVSSVVPITASYPLIALVLAIALLGDKLSPGRGFGAVLIVTGIYLIQRF
ncbi:EamA-like transporter family protein [Neomoorella glycerini]|uniref:EamA-like transporter family protein n=1 Tax=Neomoorella glycerini TaxID=55779 RepID=A0A6I5ZNF5_9FIRM|nr:EamA family transporter [Moorella glycerini]QGP91450.1 EamA-like transporter family protein [Moorella glycerini]